MTNEEAEKYAKVMTYRDAVYNALQGKCIPYRKATLIKLYELLDRLEQQPSADSSEFDNVINQTVKEWFDKRNQQQPSEDCISRKQALDDKGLAVFHRYDDYVKMRNYLKALPPVTPERPKGKWIYDGDCILCNKCLKAFGWISMNMASNFCPNCGADMNGGKEDDEAM